MTEDKALKRANEIYKKIEGCEYCLKILKGGKLQISISSGYKKKSYSAFGDKGVAEVKKHLIPFYEKEVESLRMELRGLLGMPVVFEYEITPGMKDG